MDESAQSGSVSALLVGEYESDRALVREVFGKLGWRLFEARDGRRAIGWLERNAVQVVIAEGGAVDAGWQGLLDALRDLPDPPQLVVTSRTADDFLWCEVLNRGGYDVLARPLNRDEVERVIAGAGRQFRSLRERPARVAVAGNPS
jgi:DNA-binding response OmpR family regulator